MSSSFYLIPPRFLSVFYFPRPRKKRISESALSEDHSRETCPTVFPAKRCPEIKHRDKQAADRLRQSRHCLTLFSGTSGSSEGEPLVFCRAYLAAIRTDGLDCVRDRCAGTRARDTLSHGGGDIGKSIGDYGTQAGVDGGGRGKSRLDGWGFGT